jgi:hypothetical protein
MRWNEPVILATLGCTNRRTVFKASLGRNQDPISKKKEKRAGRVAQVVECLPSKGKPLSSIPRTTKNKNNNNNKNK